MASRMESHRTRGTIQVTKAVHERLQDRFCLEARGSIQVRGRREVITDVLAGGKAPAG